MIRALLGVAFIEIARARLGHREDLVLGRLRSADAAKALLIVGVMTVHSLAEGVGVGVSFGGGEALGIFITTAIAVRNIPEGLAISLVLVPRGARPISGGRLERDLEPAAAAHGRSRVLARQWFEPVLPFGLGFAGAMVWMVATSWLPTRRRTCAFATSWRSRRSRRSPCSHCRSTCSRSAPSTARGIRERETDRDPEREVHGETDRPDGQRGRPCTRTFESRSSPMCRTPAAARRREDSAKERPVSTAARPAPALDREHDECRAEDEGAPPSGRERDVRRQSARTVADGHAADGACRGSRSRTSSPAGRPDASGAIAEVDARRVRCRGAGSRTRGELWDDEHRQRGRQGRDVEDQASPSRLDEAIPVLASTTVKAAPIATRRSDTQ